MTTYKGPNWPKSRPALSKQQMEIYNDWYQFWLSKEGLHGKFGFVDRFGHEYAAKTFYPGCKTLDIGAGNGAHIGYENLISQQYIAMEQSIALVENIKTLYPTVKTVIGDCQKEMGFAENYFDRVLAIHVLEHLENLPAALREVYHVLRPSGKFSVLIPCEGGLLYNIGRKFSSEKMFVQRYHQSYDWLIKSDHVNSAREVLVALESFFTVEHTQYFPFFVPMIEMELVVGLTLVPKK